MEGKIGKYAFFEGKIRPYQEAKIPIATHAFNYGTACFEGIRFNFNPKKKKCLILALKEHYQRLLQSCKILKIELPYALDDLCQITIELLRKEGYQQSGYIRPIAYKKDEKIGVRLTGIASDICIFTTTFGSYYPDEENVRAMISSIRRVDDNALPARAKICGSYVNSALAKDEALNANYDEAIVLTASGQVAEASAANLFMVRDDVLITPPVTENILEGITRKITITLAKNELEMEVIERPIQRSELFLAQELFLTGTACNIAAITYLNNQPIGDGKIGKVTKILRTLYSQLSMGELKKYDYLITPV